MRAYYTTYNDKVYQLADAKLVPYTIMNAVEHTHTELSHMRDNALMNLDIHISNVDAGALSNGELFTDTVAKLKTDKTTVIEKLSSVYRVYAEYSLVDNVAGCIVDEGICVNEINAGSFIFPLGITSENEFVSRLGISLNSRFEKCYRDVRPFGVTRTHTSASKFTLCIKRIYVIQLKMSAFSITPVVENKKCTPYVDSRIVPPHWNCTAHTVDAKKFAADPLHPSIPSVVSTVPQTTITDSDYIVIYDSVADGLIIDPVVMQYKPKTIHINLAFSLLDILIAAEEDIDQILTENAKNESSIGDDSQTSSSAGNDSNTTDDSDKEDISGEKNNTQTPGDTKDPNGESDTSESSGTTETESTGSGE